MERTIRRSEKEYKNFEAVAKMLEAMSPNNARYVVEDVYLDFGMGWKWTTICRRGHRECQVLNPREWQEIFLASTPEDYGNVVNTIINGKYFGDK